MCFIMSKVFQLKFVVFVFMLLIPFRISAQVNDAGLWASINLEKKFNKKWSLHFTEELRMNENITEAGVLFSEITGEYQYNKMFGFSAGYRFIQKRRVDDSYSIRHRYLFNLTVKNKWGSFSTNFRLRYQSQYADVYSSSDGPVPANFLRPKLTVKYNTQKKYTPYISGELFLHMNRADGILMDTYRMAAGVEYEFSKQSSIDLGYLVNREIQVKDPLTSYVISVGWNYTFK